MKKHLLIPIACLAVFGFFAFQPPPLHPDIAAAKVWYEANFTSPLAPNWNAAELDIYNNGNVTVSLPVSNFSNYKWRNANYPDTSQVNGATRIMIGKRPNKPYEAYFLKFDFYPSSLAALGTAGLQNIRMKPTLLNEMGFNGVCYAHSMVDSAMHGGLLFENGVPTKNVYRHPSQNFDAVSDRGCIEIWSYTQNPGTSTPNNNPWTSSWTNTTGSVYISWTATLLEIVCNNAAPWTNFGNLDVGLGQYWQYPWGLPDAWSTYPGGNTWNPPPTPPVPPDESNCNCNQTIIDQYFTHLNPTLYPPFNIFWFNVNTVILDTDCKTGTFTGGGLFKVYAAPGQQYNPFYSPNQITPTVSMNFCKRKGEPVFISPCKRKVYVEHDGQISFNVTISTNGTTFESNWTTHQSAEQSYIFE